MQRTRVVTALDRALRSGICWIAAPAGYGKTSSVLDYIRRKRTAVIWYRVDEGDQDIASFFHYLAATLPARKGAAPLPVFGPEYADQPADFARRFFRAWFARLTRRPLLVLDDLHYADTPAFRKILAILLRELPDELRCICLSRNLVPAELKDLGFKGRLVLVEESVLRFSDREARALLAARAGSRAGRVDVSAARGWAAGLVMMADRSAAEEPATLKPAAARDSQAVFAALARQMFEELSAAEQEALLTLSLLPEVTADLAEQLTGTPAVRGVLGRLHQRQLLVTRGESAHANYQMHDLLRDFLKTRLTQQIAPAELARLRERAATLIDATGHFDAAIDLALEAGSWPLAQDLLLRHAENLVSQGRRVTFTDWCAALPAEQLGAWLSYWLGVANMADDATAERWFERAWKEFVTRGDVAGQWLTAARAVLSKTDSWRTHEGLATWTRRMLDLMGREHPVLADDDELLAHAGMLRSVDFAQDYHIDNAGVRALTRHLLDRLDARASAQSANLRVTASQTLIDHAGSTSNAELFEQAVDAVAKDLGNATLSPWILGIWLVTFGAVTSRYFTYGKRGFPYGTPEEALRAAWTIGERESLRGVEFGALYHLQLLMKMRNDWSEFGALIGRIARIADSRYTTQVAVAADCQAALHTQQRHFHEAYRACERFMSAIEAANEPPLERWPHFITRFQVLLADRKPHDAAAFLEGLLALFDGALLQRTKLCVRVARAFAAKWSGSPQYPQELRACLQELVATNWSAVLINQPNLLAELAADALEREIEHDYCAGLIQRRRLTPPASRPAHWPWQLRIYLLGEFRLVHGGEPLSGSGTKAPTRTLDVLRALAIAKNHACSLQELYEWLWPDADGDAAKAACEQALHRLRKLLAMPDVILQREGKLRLNAEQVWVDLDAFEQNLSQALNPRLEAREAETAMQKAFDEFAGPLLEAERAAAWTLPAAERVRSKFLDLTERHARRHEARGDHAAARAIFLRAIDMYPGSSRCYEGLIRNRLAMRDEAGALDDYQRYRRMLETQGDANPSPAIRSLVGKLLQ